MGRKLKADFAVIGAGAFGSWTALELLRRGHSVILADAHGPANARASSGGETRIIRMSYGLSAHYSEMAQRSLVSWLTLFDFLGLPELFQPTGALFTAPKGNPHLNQSAIALRKLNCRHQRLDAAKLRQRYPQLTLPPESEGLFEPDAGVLLARRAIQAVAGHAVNLGATFVRSHFDPSTIRDHISASTYIYTCGPWLPRLFPIEIGGRIRPTRQEVFFFGVPPESSSFRMPAMPAWVDFHSGIYAVPDIENRGFKIALDAHGPPFDPEDGTRLISSASLAKMRKHLAAFVPELQNAPLVETRVCQYENTSTGEFLIDWLHRDLIVAGGGSGHGFKHGPAVGKYISDLAEGLAVPEVFSLASKSEKHARSVY